MPPRIAWTCALVSLPFVAVEPAYAELPGRDAYLERMAGWSREEALPEVRSEGHRHDTVPVRLPRLTSGFGSRRDPFDGGARFHAGIDIPGVAGSPVLAAARGVVTFAGNAGGYGRMVEIDHGNGTRTRYGHLAHYVVAPGAKVKQGEVVGRMGSTGRSTGTHLHFEVREHGDAVDPIARFSVAQRVRSVEVREHKEPHLSDFAKARRTVIISDDDN